MNAALTRPRRAGEPGMRIWLRSLLWATSSRRWWLAAAVVLVLGGVAAALHVPTSGAWFAHLANGELLLGPSRGNGASYLALHGAPLDLRSWAFDLLVLLVHRAGGLWGMLTLGMALGLLLGVLLLWGARSVSRTLPLPLILTAGLGLGALAPVLGDPGQLLLAILGVALLLALELARRHGWWGALAVAVVMALWANLQADASVGLLLVLGWALVVSWEAPGRTDAARPVLWVAPLALLGLCLNPEGPGLLLHLPLSLGMGGEHPLFASWSSIDFHPWSARWAELSALVLVLAYWAAAKHLRRGDAYLGLATAALALVWADYLPLFLMVAVLHGCRYLSSAWRAWASGGAAPPKKGEDRRGTWLWLVPALGALALLLFAGHTALRQDGPGGQARAQLPVAAARWLASQHQGGAWFTTPAFGDYLGARFPRGHHVICSSDPLPLAGKGLATCQALTVLNQGALALLAAQHPRLAVLPRAAPAGAFLLAQGWTIGYRDATTLVLAPRSF